MATWTVCSGGEVRRVQKGKTARSRLDTSAKMVSSVNWLVWGNNRMTFWRKRTWRTMIAVSQWGLTLSFVVNLRKQRVAECLRGERLNVVQTRHSWLAGRGRGVENARRRLEVRIADVVECRLAEIKYARLSCDVRVKSTGDGRRLGREVKSGWQWAEAELVANGCAWHGDTRPRAGLRRRHWPACARRGTDCAGERSRKRRQLRQRRAKLTGLKTSCQRLHNPGRRVWGSGRVWCTLPKRTKRKIFHSTKNKQSGHTEKRSHRTPTMAVRIGPVRTCHSSHDMASQPSLPWIELGGNWLSLNFGYHHEMCTAHMHSATADDLYNHTWRTRHDRGSIRPEGLAWRPDGSAIMTRPEGMIRVHTDTHCVQLFGLNPGPRPKRGRPTPFWPSSRGYCRMIDESFESQDGDLTNHRCRCYRNKNGSIWTVIHFLNLALPRLLCFLAGDTDKGKFYRVNDCTKGTHLHMWLIFVPFANGTNFIQQTILKIRFF